MKLSRRPAAAPANAAERHSAAPDHAGDERRLHQLRRSIVSLVILGILIAALLLAVPGLRGVAHSLRRADWTWIAAAIAFEFLSCLGYVLIFWLVFPRAPRRFAGRLAWAELAFGAAVSVGGAGS